MRGLFWWAIPNRNGRSQWRSTKCPEHEVNDSCPERIASKGPLRSYFAGVLLASVLSACGGSSLEAPSDTLRAYAAALEQKRVEDAYALLSDEAKRTISLESFRRMVLENPTEVMEVANALARPSGKPEVRSIVMLPNGDELVLVLEGSEWRVDAAAVDLYSQATPRQALVGFLRAVERRRYDVLLRYVPDREKEGVPSVIVKPTEPGQTLAPPDSTEGTLTTERLKEEFEGPQKDEALRQIEAIRTALPNATIEETGDEAAMSYGSGGTVSFIRERGLWKIREF